MPTVIETPGASNANSYESVAEATEYFDNRLAIVPPWPGSTDDAKRALIMATRVLDSYQQPQPLIKVVNGMQYRYIRAAWTGSPATVTQRLAWPRTGMRDGNGNALDIAVLDISVASPTVITTESPHRLTTADTVFLFDTNSTPSADGAYAVTVIDSTSFSIVLTVTVAGTEGRMTIIPRELKEALAEFAGQMLGEDRTLDSDVSKQKITSLRAGSVALSFGEGVEPQVIPDAVFNLMPPSWFTDEIIEGAVSASWILVPQRRC